MARLTYSNGVVVSVAAEKVENLLRSGFSEVEKASTKTPAAKKTTAKKAASSKSKSE